LYLEWRDLRDFCLHPFWLVLDVDRDRTSDHPTVKYSFSGGLPYPEKQWRHAKDHYQGPWIKDDATWKNFNVEFFIEADDRTLQSWENYQRRVDPTVHPDEHIVYSVLLPPVPCYPDKRTVLANSDEVLIEEKATPNPNAPNTGLGLTDAIVPGARRASTMSFGLQALPNQTYRNNSVPSTISSGAAKTPSLEKNNTFVVETQIPPSRMSSIHPPVSPILSADPSEDPSIPSVPLLSRQGEDQPAMVRPVLASSKNHATQRSGLDDTAAVSQPLLSRTHTNESAASN
jgi:hypothetical protein